MGESADLPPTDIAELQARLAAALAERDAAVAARDEALSRNDRLLHLLGQLQRMQCKLPTGAAFHHSDESLTLVPCVGIDPVS